MRRALPIVLGLVAAIVVGIATPASAHPRPVPLSLVITPASTETLTSAAPLAAPPWAVIAVVAVATLAVAWRPRRVFALLLVLVAGVLAFETGVHSVHHFGQEAGCVVAGMSVHLSADLVDITTGVIPLRVVEALIAAFATSAVVARIVAPDAGRAPPAPSA